MMSRHRANWRSAGALIASVGLALVAGCATNAQKSDPQSVLSYRIYEANRKRATILSHTIDGEKGRSPEAVKPGHHQLKIEIRWSNLWEDKTTLDVDLASGHEYEMAWYELAPGQSPAAADFTPAQPPSLGIIAAAGALSGLLFWTWPLLVPYAVIAHWNDVAPKARPFADCCFVWVQDKTSGVVVAGVHPLSEKSKGDSTAQPVDAPPATDR